jgi:predicted amidohydrolase
MLLPGRVRPGIVTVYDGSMRLTVGLAQFLATPADPPGNLERALGHVASLAARACDLIVLPELWPCGFSWDTLADDARAAAEPLDGPRGAALAAAAAEAGAWLLAGTVPERTDAGVANTAVLYAPDGRLIAMHRKVRLYTPLGEERAFVAGRELTVVAHPQLGPVGIATCFDGDFPEVARALRRAGARVVLHPAAYEVAAATWWDVLYPAQALANGQWWISVNQCGSTPSGTLLGASRVISPLGSVVAEAPRASEGSTVPSAELVLELDVAGGLARWDATCGALVDEAGEVPPVHVFHVA